ncbi:Large subunit GTPase 1 protein [Rutstroemia sp. NJR-2017a WRK4]|nr:Large subunit GTPase 1 protein [Rutstroemia sp. NJR-2017a WRK4]
MVLAKSKNSVGLGNSLMNDRFGKGKGSDRKKVTSAGIHRINHATGETYVTNERKEASWVKMRSVTEQAALDEFLSTAELAGTDFTAEKMNNVKIIHTDQKNPYLLSAAEERAAVGKQKAHKGRLTVPRRPKWDSINKADMLTLEQRQIWADYFEAAGISYKFFSASLAKELNEARLEEAEDSIDASASASRLAEKAKALGLDDDEDDDEDEEQSDEHLEEDDDEEEEASDDEANETERTRILTVDELEALFLVHAPQLEDSNAEHPRKTQIGLVGYPNVGKSSTINALIGAKKVSVSSTPGKTKHFQTIHLSEKVLLCDCPGLVFPNFATTKAELVCNGILPIDQLREFTGPAGLVAQRIPQGFLEALYGMKIVTRPLEEGGTGVPTAEEMLSAYAKARGFRRTGQGQPDESRAARVVLKDYVNGKLLFCQPPPLDIDPFEFNRELYDEGHLPEKRRQALASMDSSIDDQSSVADSDVISLPQGPKSQKLDKTFFAQGAGNSAHLRMPFNHKYSEQGTASGKQLSGRKQATLLALEKDLDPSDVKKLTSKKHFKGGKQGNGKRRADYFAD